MRSVGPWSAGTKIVECSIQNAYIQMIGAAKHYIYIEVIEFEGKKARTLIFIVILYLESILHHYR